MNKIFFLSLLSCLVFLSFSQEADTLNMGAIHLKFENYIPKKQKKYDLEIRIVSEDSQTILKSDLGDRINPENKWIHQLPTGVYTISIQLRSNYNLKIRKMSIQPNGVRLIRIDMNDVRGAFRKVSIDREFRD